MKFDFYSYMENLARQSKFLNHSDTNRRFFRMNGIRSFEELLNNISIAQMPCIGVDVTFQGKYAEVNSDVIFDDLYYNFFIFHRSRLFEFDQNKSVYLTLKDISMSFISRIIQDHRSDYMLKTDLGLRMLDVNSFSYNTLTPLPDGIVCIGVSFVIRESFLFNNFINDFHDTTEPEPSVND